MIEKRSAGSSVFHICNYTVFAIFTIICIFPFYYILINTISANNLVATGKIMLLPRGIHFGNYLEIFKLRGLAQAAMVSIARTFVGTTLTVICTALLGYAFSRQEYWKRKFWYRFVVISMYFNPSIVPWFLTMKNLGLTNNFWGYIIPMLIVPFYVILIKTSIEQIPPALEESAEIDGAGYLTRFFRIILPLNTPILATVAVFHSVAHWNQVMDTVLLMRRSSLYTLQFLLYQYFKEANALASQIRMAMSQGARVDVSRVLTPSSVRMTITMVITVPIMCVYPVLQRYFVKGIMLGAVKG